MPGLDCFWFVPPQVRVLELTQFSLPVTVTHQSASPTWLKRVSRHRVRLADVQLYVFCRQYRQHNQRRGTVGAFEINFVSEEGQSKLAGRRTLLITIDVAARRFEDVFYPPQGRTAVVSANA